MSSLVGAERFRSIFELPGVSVALVSPRGEILEANAAACHWLGYSRGEIEGLSVRDVTHPEDLETSLRFYPAEGPVRTRNFSYKKRYLRKDGKTVWGQVSAVWIPGDQGGAEHGVVLVQDITDSQNAQEAVAAERTFFQSVVDSIVDPIKVIDLNHQLLTLNRAAKKLLPQGSHGLEMLLCHQASQKC